MLRGILENKVLSSVITSSFHLINEDMLIQNIDFTDHEILPVVDGFKRIIGFVTKNDYLEALAKLNKTESSRLDAIFNSTHNGIISINLEGLITSINEQAEKMALTTKEIAIGKFLNDVVSPSGLLNVLQTGKRATEKYRVGNRLYLTHRSPIYENKKLVGAVGVFQDISEIDYFSYELDSFKQLVKDMETIMGNSSDGICITDQKGNIIKSNESFNTLYYRDLNEEKKNDTFHKMIKEVVEKGKTYKFQENNMINNNSLSISLIPIKDSHNVVERVVVNVKDMTEIYNLQRKNDQTQFLLSNLKDEKGEEEFVAISKELKNIVAKVHQIGKVDVPVLISGETGVGKEKVANFIHKSSLRQDKPFAKVDCYRGTSDLLDRQLYGYVNTADTEENTNGKAGVFEFVNGGTIFLDGIERLSIQSQDRLLGVLQEQEIKRIGSTKSIKIDVRIIAATNKSLEDLIRKGKFREKLFYKINVVPISIPPLRERKDDIPELVKVYSSVFSRKYKKSIQFNDEALKVIISADWKGNVQELISYLEQIFVKAPEEIITSEQLESILKEAEVSRINQQKPIVVNRIMPLKEAVKELERELIAQVSQTEASSRKIAEVLEVDASTIIRKIRRLEK
ncbi:sigma 54-interacting transcriptional regulator [Psychrobacillus lasiicapitis]|uniref:sigma 54-interacting transcriptional regulator n=1 Tax=Psychrobacillus lasiicapitis TaxID=1636719 RepID=UPI0014769926|nr:sigma 54-interacting transcriptional regulator [Psychrobacillus lasiicapitis]